jgi:hypothetical protein
MIITSHFNPATASATISILYDFNYIRHLRDSTVPRTCSRLKTLGCSINGQL